jgi:adenosylmethionine-8-amino-7-oxononanoate aminotransferase
MEKALKEHAREIAAIVIEPMVLGAGGMIIYPVEYLKGVKKLAQRYKVHLIADEVATGFGRTGKMFACEHAGIVPDFLCLSKGITAGTMPLGVTMTNENVFKAFYGDHAEHKTFFHGHTYTANPVACSAALTSLKIFKKEHTLKNVAVIEKKVKAFLEEISALEIVGDTRGIGAIGAIEVVRDRTSKKCFPGDARAGFEIYKIGLLEGLILRPLGNVIYFFLPLSASKSDLDVIFKKTRKTLDKFVKKISA